MSLKVVVNKTTNKVEVTSPGPQGNFYNSFKGNWSSATAYLLGDIVFYNGSSYVAIANNTNSQPPSANWSAVAKGIPGGGTTGQIIVKNSSTDYDYSWTNNYSIATTAPLTGGAAINTNPTLSVNQATTAATGVVQLSDSTSTTSSSLAATSTAVKSAYDLADAAAPKTTSIGATAPITSSGTLGTGVTIGVNAASTSAAGVVQLSDSTSTTSSVLASTPTATKAAYDLANAAAPKTTTIAATAPITSSGTLGTGVTIGVNAASTSAAGVVQLTDSISSTSTTTAATPNSVKTAYDLANAAIPLSQKAAANGVATLDASGLVPTNQLPALAITNTFVVASQAAMLALSAETGDVAVRTDLSKSFILTATPPSTLANWQELLTPPDAVSSVDGRTGTVTLSDLYAARGTTISTTAPLAGGGDLSANRTLSLNIGSSLTTSSNNLIVDSTIVPYLANANTFTAAQTATSFIVTGSTVPTNGIYLPAANTLGFATNGGSRLQINSVGEIGISATPVTGFSVQIEKNITGATASYGINNVGFIQSGVTSSATYYRTFARTANANFGITAILHYDAAAVGTFDNVTAGGSVTAQYGFRVTNTLVGATSNFGFYGDIPSAANRWNFYANGTAANYFAGQTTVGSTSLNLGSGSAVQQFGVVNSAAGNIGIVVRGAASQSSNLQEWQNSSGTNLATITSSGQVFTPQVFARYFTNRTNTGAYFDSELVSGSFVLDQRTTTAVNLITRAVASQSADLVQLQDSSGNILNAFDNQGNQRSEVSLVQYGAEGSTLQNIPTRVHPAETLLKQAVWWIDAAHTSASSQTITNLGWGGSALNVTNGSSTSADSNDAEYLNWDGVNYLYIPAGTNNTAGAPSSTTFRITDDLDIKAYVSIDDWTPADIRSIAVGTPNWPSPGYKSWNFNLQTNGTLRLVISTDGTNQLNYTSTVATGITDGAAKWIRVTRAKTAGEIKFFLSDDGITWTQLGTTVTGATTSSIFYNTLDAFAPQLGQINTVYNSGFKYYRVQISNGIDGVPVLDIDTSVITSGAATSFTALSGQTITISRATSGRKTVCVTNPLWLFGTDDYMEVNNRWLEHTGSNYLYLPGVSGNYASTPNAAPLQITGDLDIRVKVALDDWTPSAETALIGRWGGSYSYLLTVGNTGLLRFQWLTSGSVAQSRFSTVATGITDGSTKWVRATLDVDNGASGHDVQFFTSDDGTTWTQLGTTVTTAGTSSVLAGSALLGIGAVETGTSTLARGKFFRAQVLNGIGGTVAFDANFETGITSNLPTTFTESSANAATVTVNYSGTGYRSAGVIASTYVYPGNPNTFKLSTTSLLDFGASDSFTALVVARQWATPLNFGRFMEKADSSAVSGYSLSSNGTAASLYAQINDGTNTATRIGLTSLTAGNLVSFGTIVNRSTQTISSFGNGTISATASTSSIGSISNVYPLRIGSRSAATAGSYQDLEGYAAAIWRRALTAAEIATLNNYFQGRVA